MRTFFAVLLIATAAAIDGAAAEPYYPWCIRYGAYASTNCGFVSDQQCRGTIGGNGDMCVPNPFYVGADKPYRSARKRVRN